MKEVKNPSHYNLYPVESVEMAERIWGKYLAMHAAFIKRSVKPTDADRLGGM